MKLSRLFTRTLLLTVAVFGVIALCNAVLIARTLHQSMTREFTAKGEAVARSIANTSGELLLNRDASTIQSYLDLYLEISGISYVFVTDPKGEVLAHTFVPAMPAALRGLHDTPPGPTVRTVGADGRSYIDVAMPILAGVAGFVHVGMDQQAITRSITLAILKQQGILAAIMGLCLIVLFVLVNRISRPLVHLAEYAKRLGDQDFSADVPIESDDEIGILARTMRSMALQIRGLVSRLEHEVQVTRHDLQDALTHLRTIIDSLADGLLVIDVTGRVVQFNPALLEMFGFTPDTDLTGKDARLMFPSDLAALAGEAKGGHDGARTAEIALCDGNTGKAVARPVLARGEGSPACLGTVILIRDVTAEKEIDRMKTDFITTVSHELRTPLTSVLGFAKIIAKRFSEIVKPRLPDTDPRTGRAARQIEDNLAIIVSEGERLTELINDVLDISKMEAGKIEWRMRETDLSGLVRQAVASIRPLMEQKGLACRVEMADSLPLVRIDRDRIIQVLVNLLSNALKFTAQGSVTVTAEADKGRIYVTVADTGAGISERDQSGIFERFKQAGDTLTEKPKGTGLGLPICRYIVESHGGRIWVESEPGKGSAFHFTLPLSDQTREFEAAPPLAQSRPLSPYQVRCQRDGNGTPRILVVDDEAHMRLYLRQVLEGEGFLVQDAEDGFKALQAAVTNPPDLITMDLMLPHMDGGTVIQALRSSPATRDVPVLVITALDGGETKGADASLTKPVDEERLLAAIRALLHGGPTTGGPCMVLSKGGIREYEGLPMICQGQVAYCAVEEIEERLARGFSGTVFIPSGLTRGLDLSRLASSGRAQVVILPEAEPG
ncbi:multi-sensor hybrid histidine kinase [Desulfovibrio sp. X2]|uniref:ATP-binding protein n=1 Tax=Desulfovibrio sp. X2 TaxID=941449 RepID=UPI000358D188|nr:ATP-binding protein [Desulfovibrio sp. X2]EPR41919.1 multi-sensor hybrid histidine kinase [Desulfovibrio sp. X2]